MADISGTLRHPAVVAARIKYIADRIAHLRGELAVAEDELRQMNCIVTEMLQAERA